jgi:hypothetical protein
MSQHCFELDYIFRELKKERSRQDAKHPWIGKWICKDIPEGERELHKLCADKLKEKNDNAEDKGIVIVEDVLLEEIHETWAEEDEVKREDEALQAAAVLIRFVQHSREKRSQQG